MPSTVQTTLRTLRPSAFLALLFCLVGLTNTAWVRAEEPRVRVIAPLAQTNDAFHAKSSQRVNLLRPPHPKETQPLFRPIHQTAPLAKVLEERPHMKPAQVFEDLDHVEQDKVTTDPRRAPYPKHKPVNQLRSQSRNQTAYRVASTDNIPIYPVNHLRREEEPSQAFREPSPLQRPALLVSQNEPQQLHLPEPEPLPYKELVADKPSETVSLSSPPSPIPLPKSSSTAISLPPKGKGDESQESSGGILTTLVTMGGALLLVIGLFLVFAWTMRRTSTRRTGGLLPQGVVEVLGHQTITGRQRVHLLRIGKRLLLVSIMPDSVETLTEITDPAEVDRIAGVCCQTGKGSSTEAFQAMMRQFTQDPSQSIPSRPPTVDQIRQRLSS